MAHYLATGDGPVLNRRIELEALRADGSRFPVELAISPISSGKRPRFTAYLRDITLRKQAEAEARESERRYREGQMELAHANRVATMAQLTGSIAVVGIMGGPTAGGCVSPVSINPGPCSWDIPASFFWNTYRQIVVEGALAALATGLATLGVLALVHLRAPAEDLRPAGAAG